MGVLVRRKGGWNAQGCRVPQPERLSRWEQFLRQEGKPESAALVELRLCGTFRKKVYLVFSRYNRYRRVFLPEEVLVDMGWKEDVERAAEVTAMSKEENYTLPLLEGVDWL